MNYVLPTTRHATSAGASAARGRGLAGDTADVKLGRAPRQVVEERGEERRIRVGVVDRAQERDHGCGMHGLTFSGFGGLRIKGIETGGTEGHAENDLEED